MKIESNPEIASKVAVVTQRLLEAKVGEIVPWDTVRTILGERHKKKLYQVACVARRRARKEKGAVFGTVIKVGMKRLADSEIHSVGDIAINRIRGTARNASASMACADLGKLTNSQRAMHFGKAAVLAVVADQTTRTAVQATIRAQMTLKELADATIEGMK